MTLVRFLLQQDPNLKYNLYKAHLNETPTFYIKKNLNGAAMMGITAFIVGMLFFWGLQKIVIFSILLVIGISIVCTFAGYLFLSKRVYVAIRNRERMMERDVLFAGRYLLVKLQSGAPFFQSLIDASKGAGTANQFFKEIVDDVYTGTPLEEAMEKAAHISPSKNFKMIILQMNNALKSGVDVTSSLKALIQEITDDHIIEIERYNKKLNSLTMFYMLLAVVVPSLGMTFFVIIAGFIQISLSLFHLMFICVFLAFLQFMFLSIFKSIRPLINM